MRSSANINEFQVKVAEIVEEAWSVNSATAYNAKADELDGILAEKRNILTGIDNALAPGFAEHAEN